MNRPVHFEIPASNMEKAAKFYGDIFGWKFQKWEGPMEYWLIETGPADQPGINGGLMPNREGTRPVNTMDVADIDETIAKVQKAGGTVVVPKMAIPGIGWLIYALDLDGNMFGAMQNDPNAR